MLCEKKTIRSNIAKDYYQTELYMVMRNIIKHACCATLLLLCFLVFNVQAQQGNTAAKPAISPTLQAGGAAKPDSDAAKPPGALDIRARATERAIDGSIPDDPAVDAILAPYSAKVRELDKVIGKLESDLKKGGMGGGSLGNFVADALRDRAQAKLGKPVLLAVMNSSGLRKNRIAAGDISATDIYELLPFENALVTLDLNGEQLRRFLDVTVARRNAQSGARITYRANAEKKNEIVTVKLGGAGAVEAREIDPKATYTIVTIDYLVKRGGDYSVLQEAKNVRSLGLTMRDAVLDYVKAEAAAGRAIKATLDGRFRYDRSAPAKTADEEP
jgi:2',3'-cyclic-nucleotide 2'-phosphodiesterase (5'-nucleotidase family)